MPLSRRVFFGLAAAVTLGGCSRQAPATWLQSLSGVDKAEQVDGKYVLTLQKQLPDSGVRSLVSQLKKEFESHVEDYDDAVELAVDGFRARIYPSVSTQVEQDLDRTLWLRKDGRAAGSTYGSSGLIITTPAPAAADVALGFDQITPSTDGRRTHRVETADRSVVIEWTDCPPLGFKLDRAAAQRFADLQKRYRGLTGWLDGPGKRTGVYFAARDISLDGLLANLPTFDGLELGWGPARAAATDFAHAFTPAVRQLTTTLAVIPGVTRLDLAQTGPHTISVKNRAAYGAVVKQLSAGPPLRVNLVRRPSKYVGRQGNPTFECWTSDDSTTHQVYNALADVTGVVRVQVGSSLSNLVLANDITDADLTTAHTATAALPAIDLYLSRDPDTLDVERLGKVTKGRYLPASPAPALAPRVSAAWAR